MCEPEGSGVPLGGVLAVAGIVAGGAVVVRVLAAAAPFLAALGAVTVVLGVASVPVTRLLARRVCYRSGPLAHKFRPPPRQRRVRRVALTAGRRMIEAPHEVVVTPDMILRQAVKEKAR